MANPEVVVRDCDTDARAFGLPSNRIRGYDDLVERSLMGLQKNSRSLDAYFHLQNDECDNMVEKMKWDAGEYFAGRGRRLAVCVHFVPKAWARRERPQFNAEEEVIEISSGSEGSDLRIHPAPSDRLPEGYGCPAAPGAVPFPFPTSRQSMNYQRRPAIFRSNKRGQLISFKPSAKQDVPIIETSRPEDYGRPESALHKSPVTKDHHPGCYECLAPATARQQAPVTATKRHREGYGRPASPIQNISRPYETIHPWAPPPTGRRGVPVYELPKSRLEKRSQQGMSERLAATQRQADILPLSLAADERIEQPWENIGDRQVNRRSARQTSSPLFCTPPPAATSEAKQEHRVPAPLPNGPITNSTRNVINLSPSLVNTDEDEVSSRKLKNKSRARKVVESDDERV